MANEPGASTAGADVPLAPPEPLLPPAWRWAGPLLAAGFGCAIELRRLAYGARLCRARRAPLPVLCVGNLTVGGTGKTPAALYLTRGLVSRNLARKPAVVLRGYAAPAPGEANDEARELLRAWPDLTVIANPDRHAGVCAAAEAGCDAAVLDDGFQHWRLARDLDIVLLDASDPFGGGHLLPWGRLRECPRALARAGVIVLTRSDLAAPQGLDELTDRVTKFAPGALICRGRHEPSGLRRLFSSAPAELAAALAGKRVLAACGLGHPEAFFATLARLGAHVIETCAFSDHHHFSAADLNVLLAHARAAKAEGLVVTEKDAAKLERLPAPGPEALPLWALTIAFAVSAGEDRLWERVAQAMHPEPEKPGGTTTAG